MSKFEVHNITESLKPKVCSASNELLVPHFIENSDHFNFLMILAGKVLALPSKYSVQAIFLCKKCALCLIKYGTFYETCLVQMMSQKVKIGNKVIFEKKNNRPSLTYSFLKKPLRH